ncbi:MAG TPA: efflux RND transporter periplasmic adaptor subunit, partial [Opitutaceae bacterium]|nr:efflux RND transporter periplasmic adaptor subunit [Opitutaceae bacterium]
ADRLRPDITGEVTVTVDERPSDTIIPRRALFGRNVYVVRDGRVRLQPVTVGFVSLTAVEVLTGLSKGDYVIIDKIDQFRDGDRVRIKEVDAL